MAYALPQSLSICNVSSVHVSQIKGRSWGDRHETCCRVCLLCGCPVRTWGNVLDAAFMVHVEAGRGNWSAFADITYLSTSEPTERPHATVGRRLLRRFARRALHVRAIGPIVDRHARRTEFRGFGRNVPVASQLCVLSGQAKAEQHFVRLPVQERGVQRRRRKYGLHVRRSDGRLQFSFLGAGNREDPAVRRAAGTQPGLA
jgi:hypothetical protein